MLILVALWLIAPFGIQCSEKPATFVVERVEAHAQFDSAYILALANTLVPPDRPVTQSDVECLVSELKDSGLFDKVEAKWNNPDLGVRRLLLYCTSKPNRSRITISKFTLSALPGVNEEEFLKRMGDKGAVSGIALSQFSYDELNDIIDDSIHKSVSADFAGKYNGSAWVQFRVDESGSVEVLILPESPNCKIRSHQTTTCQ
jgi:hypothetical protein